MTEQTPATNNHVGSGSPLPHDDFTAGTDRQRNYIIVLAKRRGFASPLAACAAALGRSPEDIKANPPDTSTARKVIEYLEQSEASEERGAGSTGQGGVTAQQLRRIADSGSIPADLDEDSRRVVEALIQNARIKVILAVEEPVAVRHKAGVNANARIELEHLLKYFKTWDNLADAFKVTVPTAKAWGQYVPENRVFEAEVRTNGYVRVPRDGRGRVL